MKVEDNLEGYSPLCEVLLHFCLSSRYHLHKMSLALLSKPSSLLSTIGISGWLIEGRLHSLP